jgi:hypothetical protein
MELSFKPMLTPFRRGHQDNRDLLRNSEAKERPAAPGNRWPHLYAKVDAVQCVDPKQRISRPATRPRAG